MAHWIEQQHSGLLEDLTATTIDNDPEYNREQEAHNKAVKALLDHKDQRISELSDEVASLKKRIATTTSTSSQPLAVHSPHQVAVSPAEGSSSPAPNETQLVPDFKTKYLEYKKAYDALKGNHRMLWDGYKSEKTAKQQVRTELADLQARYDSLERRLNELDHIGQDGPGSENGADIHQPPAWLAPIAATATSPTIEDHEVKQHEEEEEAEETPAQTRQSPKLPPLSLTATDDDPPIKQERSSSPVIMSERPVRKRGRDGPSHTQKRVKTEHSSQSTPRALSHAEMPGSEDSLDLGEVGQHLATPKKRKDQESGAENTPTLVFQQPLGITPLRDQPSAYVKAPTNTVRPAPLTPLDPNRMANRKSTKKAKRTKAELLNGVKILAEDGNGDESKAMDENNAVTPAPKSRLDDLLNTPSDSDSRPGVPCQTARRQGFATPRGESLLVGSRSKSRPTRLIADELMIPKARQLPWQSSRKENGPQEQQQSIASPATPVPRATRVAQDTSTKAIKRTHGSLRTKPVSELHIGDFKVNPAANEGYDFAYTDVVRGKESRSKIGGCVDMHCCGKEMRALALSDRPEPPLTAAQQEEERKYLEDYLGDFAYKLDGMDQVERDELWLKAKTQELADKYSKHRDRFRRVQSPPGYWNADFPSTQDIQAEKAEAAKKVRETVEDRYREALRPGGLWMFRDED